MKENLFIVGKYIELFNTLSGQRLPCAEIYQSKGLKKHIEKRHPNEMDILSKIPLIIAAPDFVGHNPKEPDSVELVKVLGDNLMVCIKLDVSNGVLFVASAFSISSAKLNNRLNSGRLVSVKNVDKAELNNI